MKYFPKITGDGSIRWKDDNGDYGRLEDKPSLIHADSVLVYLKNNVTHRDDNKPAIIWPNGRKIYYTNGVFDRWEREI